MGCSDLSHIHLWPKPWTAQDEIDRLAYVGHIIEALPKRGKLMHYKNGREAKNGDKVILIPSYGAPVVGILYDATAGNDFCNGRIAPTSPNDPSPNLKECLHFDDVNRALLVHGVKDTSAAAEGPNRLMTKDAEAVAAAKRALYQFAQYTYTLGDSDVLKIVQAVDAVRRKQAQEELT